MKGVFIGIDWGTTHRRAALLSATGELLAEVADAEGALACAGRHRESLEALIARWPEAQPGATVVMAGMIGAAIGWQAVPYVEAPAALAGLGARRVRVGEAPADRQWFIVPGVCVRTSDGEVDVMRGEETQLLGASQWLGPAAADGDYVLPGTHSKWVRLEGGRVQELRTYLTGELFALLRQHGTLASVMSGGAGPVDPDDPAFLHGLQDAAHRPTLSHALFGARARVVTGVLEPAAAAAYVSGLLIGAEWADVHDTVGATDRPVRMIGEPALAALHAVAARVHRRRLQVLDARAIQLAAWRALQKELA